MRRDAGETVDRSTCLVCIRLLRHRCRFAGAGVLAIRRPNTRQRPANAASRPEVAPTGQRSVFALEPGSVRASLLAIAARSGVGAFDHRCVASKLAPTRTRLRRRIGSAHCGSDLWSRCGVCRPQTPLRVAIASKLASTAVAACLTPSGRSPRPPSRTRPPSLPCPWRALRPH